ncbi:MAG: lytic transglycosylase domain-containing protein [Pseudomonadota bacterium]
MFALVTILATGAQAQSEFTFKRVKPGGETAGKRITIQVEPPEPEVPLLGNSVNVGTLPTPSLPGPRPGAGGTSEWFWTTVSPSIEAAHSTRLELARQAVLQDRPDSLPSQARMVRMVDEHGVAILTQSAPHAVSPALVLAVMAVESDGRAQAKSSAGAVGLMQLMPQTAARFDVTDREDPEQSLAGGAEYLAWLIDEFKGDAPLALAAYNAGEGAVSRAGGVPDYAETRAYVPKVIAAWSVARDLCLTPPVKATDGCLFKSSVARGN